MQHSLRFHQLAAETFEYVMDNRAVSSTALAGYENEGSKLQKSATSCEGLLRQSLCEGLLQSELVLP